MTDLNMLLSCFREKMSAAEEEERGNWCHFILEKKGGGETSGGENLSGKKEIGERNETEGKSNTEPNRPRFPS